MAAQGKFGPLASKALTQVGIKEQKAPVKDLASRLDTPLDDLVKQNRKPKGSLLERARAKARAKPKAKAVGDTGVAKKVIAKDAKQTVRAILTAPQKGAKPKAPGVRPAPHLVTANSAKKIVIRKPAAAQQKPAAQRNKPAAAPKFTISLSNDRKPKPAAHRVQLKPGSANGGGVRRSVVAANTAQKRQDQRQQVVQARRVITAGSAPAVKAGGGGRGLTLSERFSHGKGQHQQQQGGRNVQLKGGRKPGSSFRVQS